MRPSRHSSVYLIGNPAIATQIVRIDVRGSFYVPFRVAIFEQDDQPGAVISFNRPSSFLGARERTELAEIGRLLDSKIDAVVQRMCDGGAGWVAVLLRIGCVHCRTESRSRRMPE
jgi:uncharacterized protein (DUF302 family)